MKNKGIKNIEIADCLNERIINGTKSKECFKGYTREELYPMIVNRWYYGLYLIAKDILGLDYAHHKGRRWDEKEKKTSTGSGIV